MAPETVAAVRHGLRTRRGLARAALVALRPRQWTKNLLLFAGIVFAAELGDPRRLLAATAAFLAWCAASSAAYLINDIRDAAADRLHPVKRSRPIASGQLPVEVALGLACALVALAVALTATLGPAPLGCLGAFLALQGAYTAGLKRIVLVDVLTIAGLFVLRSLAGAVAVDVRISVWLPVCTGLLALLLALGKRRAELQTVDPHPSGRATRDALGGYSKPLLERLLLIVACATISVYAVYALGARDSRMLVVTVPFVATGVVRYLVLLRRGHGEEPESVLLGDRLTLVLVAGWVVACAAILAAAE